MVGAIIAWLVTCASLYDEVNVDNLGKDYPMLAGALSCGSSAPSPSSCDLCAAADRPCTYAARRTACWCSAASQTWLAAAGPAVAPRASEHAMPAQHLRACASRTCVSQLCIQVHAMCAQMRATCVAGNVTALGFSLIVTTVLSFAFPQNFDWDVMRTGIRMIEMDGTDALATSGEDSAEALEGALKCAPYCCTCFFPW